jgi:hypothetical protein
MFKWKNHAMKTNKFEERGEIKIIQMGRKIKIKKAK